MKITVDTNVLISATFWYGASNKIMELAENKKLILILSEEIIEEYINVLNYKEIKDKIKNKNLDLLYPIQKIISVSSIVRPTIKLNIIKEDIEDNKVLECAKEGYVKYIITQDKHLLKLKRFGKISILRPEEFLEVIES